MTQEAFLVQMARYLESVEIPFMVVGSLCSSYHGEPRATNDVDLVIDPTIDQLDRFLALLGDRYYVSQKAARDALHLRSLFNVVDYSGGWKADLIICKTRVYSAEEFQRRRVGTLHGHPMPIAAAEDVILTKLEWDKLTPSERQVTDALNVAKVQWSRLDQSYLRKWAPALGVSDRLEELLRVVEQFHRGEGR